MHKNMCDGLQLRPHGFHVIMSLNEESMPAYSKKFMFPKEKGAGEDGYFYG